LAEEIFAILQRFDVRQVPYVPMPAIRS